MLSPAFLQAERVLQVRFFWPAVSWSGWAEGDLLGAARWPEGAGELASTRPRASVSWGGAALAGCLPPGREAQPVPCSTCDPSCSPLTLPRPLLQGDPHCLGAVSGGGSVLLGQWLPSQEEEAPGTWASRWGQPRRSPPGPPVPADGGQRSCPPVAWQVQAAHSCLGERTTESCVLET